MTADRASVLVTTYSQHRWDDLVRTIASLRSQTLMPAEILVVVDHNPDLIDRVRTDLAHVIALQNTNRRGLAGARNAGVASARSEVVVFVDDDAEAAPDWLETLLAAYSEPRVLGVGGAIEPVWDPARPEWLPSELDWVVGCSYTGLPTITAPVRNLIGCNMSFRRAAILDSGGFTEGIGRVGRLPFGGEETELCIRIRQRCPNHLLLYEPRARVRHHVPADRQRWSYMVHRCYSEGLSKAQVAVAVGSGDGLSAERDYVLRTIPRAVLRELSDFTLRRRLGGLRRTAAMLAGVALATVGYCWGRVEHGWRPERARRRAEEGS